METITRKDLENMVGHVVRLCISEKDTVEGKLGMFGAVGVEEKGERVLKILPKGEESLYIDQLIKEGYYGIVNGSVIKIKDVLYKVSL